MKKLVNFSTWWHTRVQRKAVERYVHQCMQYGSFDLLFISLYFCVYISIVMRKNNSILKKLDKESLSV